LDYDFWLPFTLPKIFNPLVAGENQSEKTAYYQMIVLTIGLIICGFILVFFKKTKKNSKGL